MRRTWIAYPNLSHAGLTGNRSRDDRSRRKIRPPDKLQETSRRSRNTGRLLTSASVAKTSARGVRKARNPKSEIRNKSRIRNHNVPNGSRIAAGAPLRSRRFGNGVSDFGFRASNLFRISCFGFRISVDRPHPHHRVSPLKEPRPSGGGADKEDHRSPASSSRTRRRSIAHVISTRDSMRSHRSLPLSRPSATRPLTGTAACSTWIRSPARRRRTW